VGAVEDGARQRVNGERPPERHGRQPATRPEKNGEE